MSHTPIKTAIITGAASGMGREMTLRLARSGVRVAAVDLNEAALKELAGEASGISTYVCDVSDLEQVRSIVADAEKELGRIDRLAHCAALMPGGRIDEVTTEDIVRLMRINYDGTVAVTKAVLPAMQQRAQGQIVIFGSIAGYAFSERFGAYQATKAAVNAYGEVLANELKGSGVRVLLVAPPMVRTPLVQQSIDTGPQALAKMYERGGGLEAAQVINAIEKSLKRGRKSVVLPGQARAFYAIRRASPGLLWWLSRRMG